ncbi:hypothetical protein D9M68_631160 [compost metagenome]
MRIVIFTLTALLPCIAWAWETPEKALMEYLKYDADGYRLGGGNWKTYVDTYLDVSESYDEPGYDMITVIASYSVSKPICHPEFCASVVTYELFDTNNAQDQNVAKHAKGEIEKRVFTITNSNNEWRIKTGMGNPYILSEIYKNKFAMRSGL